MYCKAPLSTFVFCGFISMPFSFAPLSPFSNLQTSLYLCLFHLYSVEWSVFHATLTAVVPEGVIAAVNAITYVCTTCPSTCGQRCFTSTVSRVLLQQRRLLQRRRLLAVRKSFSLVSLILGQPAMSPIRRCVSLSLYRYFRPLW